jgi:hypothetical protein
MFPLQTIELMKSVRQASAVQIMYRHVPVFQGESRLSAATKISLESFLHRTMHTPSKCDGSGIVLQRKPTKANIEKTQLGAPV